MGHPLGLQHIVLVDDTVRANEWEQDIYRMAVPEGMGIEFADRAEALERLPGWEHDPRRSFLLTGDVETMAALVEGSHGLIRRVNLGGVHAGPGRRERIRYLYLSEEEADILRRLEAGGIVVTAQDLPTNTAIPIGMLL
jgi:mannose/fructose/N-acetylgalactosamine-specific phosphotransferase system component IIB